MEKKGRKPKKERSVKDRLIHGETMPGRVQGFNERGAIINVSGVLGYLRNRDFSDDGTLIKERYQLDSIINVKFKSLDKRGRINFLPEKFHNGTVFIDREKVKKGSVYIGRVTHSKPAGYEVVIDAGLFVFCNNNLAAANLYDRVVIEITQVYNGTKDKPDSYRGRIIRVKTDE